LPEITRDIFRVRSRCLAAWFFIFLPAVCVPGTTSWELVVPGTHAAKHRLHTRKISRVISVKHVQHSLMMDRKRSETCRS